MWKSLSLFKLLIREFILCPLLPNHLPLPLDPLLDLSSAKSVALSLISSVPALKLPFVPGIDFGGFRIIILVKSLHSGACSLHIKPGSVTPLWFSVHCAKRMDLMSCLTGITGINVNLFIFKHFPLFSSKVHHETSRFRREHVLKTLHPSCFPDWTNSKRKVSDS